MLVTTLFLKVLGELLLKFHRYDKMLLTLIKPSYVLLNNTSLQLAVSPSITNGTPPFSPAICLQNIPAEEAKPIIFWRGSSSSGVHTVSFSPAVEEKQWSISLSPDFVRHSFALPTNDPQSQFVPALLTMHEFEDVTYLVVADDASPRFLIQNLCSTALEVVEHGTPQQVPPGQQVVYEPPTLAKMYPLVYDEEIASNPDKELWKASKNVSIKIRTCSSIEATVQSDWSEPFPLFSDGNRMMMIPGMGSVFVSTDTQGVIMFISLLPTGDTAPLQPAAGSVSLSNPQRTETEFDFSVAQLVLCLDSETLESSVVSEVLRVIAGDTHLHYSSSNKEGTKICFTLETLHIDNMTEKCSAEYAVTLLPRDEHARRASLIEVDAPPLAKLTVHYDPLSPNCIRSLCISVQPLTVQLEDSLLHRLRSVIESYGLPGVMRSKLENKPSSVPYEVKQEASRDASPLVISSLVIGPTAFYLNARISLKVLLSCSDSPFRFPRYELVNIYSNWSEVSHTLAAHYATMIVMHVGWLLGSLELIGSPAAFILSVGRGLRDLVTLPYQGLTRSPTLFILGIGHGTAAFFHHFSSGALKSVTNMASSVARNMERLSMDPDHISYQDQQRRERPVTHFTSGVVSGISSFGLSLMSAVAGIVEQPMQSIHRMDESATVFGTTKSVLSGVGKGLIGAVAKPVGGAMELVSHTGQGIMQGTGLAQKLTHKSIELPCYTGPIERTSLPTTATRCAK